MLRFLFNGNGFKNKKFFLHTKTNNLLTTHKGEKSIRIPPRARIVENERIPREEEEEEEEL